MKTEIQKHNIEPRIFTIRGVQVMLDSDLSIIFHAQVKRINEQVKRNIQRFPETFSFQLNPAEWTLLKSQIATSKQKAGGKTKPPRVFTEHGIAMLASVLNSVVAVELSIEIINSFIKYRKITSHLQFYETKLELLENTQIMHTRQINEILENIQTKNLPSSGVFFNDQVFDAYIFSCELIQKAKKSIVLIDNYIDETTLLQLSKRQSTAAALIYTEKITPQLKLDLQKHNSQYPSIDVSTLKKVHDRFIIIDDTELYHLGASLKDLGKKWFAFSRIDSILPEIISKLHDKKQ
jgi:hypothetical protein